MPEANLRPERLLARDDKGINGRLHHPSLVGASSTCSRDPHSLEALWGARETLLREMSPPELLASFQLWAPLG